MTEHLEQLTAADMEVLEFERATWKYAGVKDAAIRDRFGISATRYYLRLNTVLAKPAAEAYDPPHVRRLRQLRAGRARARGAKHTGWA